jgi:hypothetical protein
MTNSIEKATYFKALSALGKEAMARKKASGERMHLAPLGYRNTRLAGRAVMQPDLRTLPLVQEAKRLHAEGRSIRSICSIMVKKGLRSQRGKVIGPSSMLRILRSP